MNRLPKRTLRLLGLWLFLRFASGLPAQAQDATLPKTLSVMKQTLTLKENKGGHNGFIAEYIPANENFDNWTIMFAVRFLAGNQLDPKTSAESTAKNVKARRAKGDPLANAMVLKAADGKSYVIDFLVSEAGMYEHNVWRFFRAANGLVSYQIARRIYSNNSTPDAQKTFISAIATLRQSILDELLKPQLPIPQFAN